MSIKIKSATIFRFDGVSRGRIFQRKSPPIVSRIHASNSSLLPVKCLLMPVLLEPPFVLSDHLQNVVGDTEVCLGNVAPWITKPSLRIHPAVSPCSLRAITDSFHEFVKAPAQR